MSVWKKDWNGMPRSKSKRRRVHDLYEANSKVKGYSVVSTDLSVDMNMSWRKKRYLAGFVLILVICIVLYQWNLERPSKEGKAFAWTTLFGSHPTESELEIKCAVWKYICDYDILVLLMVTRILSDKCTPLWAFLSFCLSPKDKIHVMTMHMFASI